MTKERLGYALLLVLAMLAPAWHALYPIDLMRILCFALFACAFNLLIGYTGILSFGHAAFFGTAGYVAGHALKVFGLPTELGLLLGALVAAGLGWVIGGLAIRRAGIYMTMITLAMAQMVYFVFLQAPFTGGEDGLQDVPRGHLLGFIDLSNDYNAYYFVLGIFVFGFWLIHRTIHSPFGQILKAIRENEPRAISLGYDVAKYKLLAFILSAGLAGLAGATKVFVFRFAALADANWPTSGEVVLMTLMGGMGTVLGPVVGAAILVELQDKLADKVGSLVTTILGAIFVFFVLVLRRGFVGEALALGERVKRWRVRSAAKARGGS